VSKAPLSLVLLPNGSGDGWEKGFGRELFLSFLVMNLHACDGSMDILPLGLRERKGKERDFDLDHVGGKRTGPFAFLRPTLRRGGGTEGEVMRVWMATNAMMAGSSIFYSGMGTRKGD